MEHGAIDLHKKESQIRIVTESGETVDRRIATTRERLTALFEGRRPMRILVPTENSIRVQIDHLRRGLLPCTDGTEAVRLDFTRLGPHESCHGHSHCEDSDERRPGPPPANRVGESRYAASRSCRWCSPPTCGMATTGPSGGGEIGQGRGESLASERCVRE